MAGTSGNQDADSISFRTALRREKIAARMGLDDAGYARVSAMIEKYLMALLRPLQPGMLAFCWPVRREFDCRPLAAELIESGWQACQPVVVEPGAPMRFRPWTPETPMTTDRHGIPIPAGDGEVSPDVVLLPLVAFDEQGYRLGYGGGYFDRTLAAGANRPLAVGVGFELARVDTIHPAVHDLRLDAIVTEAGVRRFTRIDRDA